MSRSNALQPHTPADLRAAVRAAGDRERRVSVGHQARCRTCRLSDDELADLRAAFVAWEPLGELAEVFGVPCGSIMRHAHAAGWADERLTRLGHAYAQIAADGVAAGRAGKATPRDALRALELLEELHPPATPVSISAPSSAGPCEPLTWEAQVRLRGKGAPPQLAGPDPLAQPAVNVQPVAVQADQAHRDDGDPRREDVHPPVRPILPGCI